MFNTKLNMEVNSPSNEYQDPEKFRLAVTRAIKRQKKQEKYIQRQIYNNTIKQTTNVVQNNVNETIEIKSPRSEKRKSILPESKIYEPLSDGDNNLMKNTTEALIMKVRQEENLDDVITNIIDELRVRADEQSDVAYWKSIRFSVMDGILRTLIVLLGISVGILGQNNISSNEETIPLIIAIMGFAISGLAEARDQFKLGKRSGVLRKCYQDFKSISTELRILSVSGKDPIDIILHITEIENRINMIDREAFGNNTKKSSETKVKKLPTFFQKTSPVGNDESQIVVDM